MNPTNLLPLPQIQNRIFTIRGVQVMIDRDLAELYGVETKVLNQAVKRNIERFPNFYRFQLNNDEKNELVTNCDRFKTLRHSSVNPYAFLEQGVAMLSAVLKSKTAVKVSISIMNAFVEMRKLIATNAGVFQRLDKVEQKQIIFNKRFEKLFEAFENNDLRASQGIYYDGQVFDAYTFVSDLIRSAKKSIVIIDNYVDDTVLTLLTKREKSIPATIFTKKISKQLSLDLEKHNAQYPAIEIKVFKNIHDRFIIIDDKVIYHFGASLKDLGKKWFAFSKMDLAAIEMLNRLEVNNLGQMSP